MRVKIGETYFYDILGESNMSATTAAVTVIKKSPQPNKWTVLSVNTQEVFDCDKEMLTPIVDPKVIQPLIRCEYGVAPFTESEVFTAKKIIPELMKLLTQTFEDSHQDMLSQECIDNFNNDIRNLCEKVENLYEISQYKKFYSAAIAGNKALQNLKKLKELDSAGETNNQDSTNDDYRDKLFKKKFSEAIEKFNEGDNRDPNILGESVKKTIYEYFPFDMTLEDCQKPIIYGKEIKYVFDVIKKSLYDGYLIFLIGVGPKAEKIVDYIFGCKTDDEDINQNMINFAYEKFSAMVNRMYGYDLDDINSESRIYCGRHIATITVGKDADNNEEE
jgi:hypothetical protein